MIPAHVLQKMILAHKPIIPLTSTTLHIAIDELDLVSRHDVAVDVSFAGERRIAAFPSTGYSSLMISVIQCQPGSSSVKMW
jgi:hypothetical protein